MTSDSPIMWVSSILLLCALAPGLALTFARPATHHHVTVLFVIPLIAAAIVGGTWLLFLSASPSVSLYQGAVAAVCTVPVLAIGLRQARLRGMAGFMLVWSALVLAPVGHALFDVRDGLVAAALGTLDFGGVAVLALCTGAAGGVFAFVTRGTRSEVGGAPAEDTRRVVLSSTAIVVGFLGLALGAELAIDEASVVIVRNVLMGCALGALGWMAAQLLTARRIALVGMRSGLIAGALAVLAALPWLEPGAAITLAVVAGMLGELSTVWLERKGAGDWAQLGGTLFVPGIVGLVGAGVLARGVGLLYSGHAIQLQAQFLGLVAVVSYAVAATAILAIAMRLMMTKRLTSAALQQN